jgi:hypothetical protein
MRGQVNVFAGISKTGTATIEPGGRGHEGIPPDRADLKTLEEQMKQPLKLRYGAPSCQARLRMVNRDGAGGENGQRMMGTAEDVR